MSYFVHESSFLDEGAIVGKGTKIWHFSHVMGTANIGENCNLGQNVFVGNYVKIGKGVKIQNNVSIYSGVELKDYVFCGPSMVFTNDMNPRAAFPKEPDQNYLSTTVGYGASIGANATIICGHRIGDWAFIGAGAVINSDVPNYALMVGVPAKQIGWICKCGEKLVEKTNIKCSNCHREYQKTDPKMIIEKSDLD